MDVNSILIWQKFNCYHFIEKTHQYLYHGKPVKYSVTGFTGRFVEPFDSEGISKKYAEKRGLNQQDVLKEWEQRGKVSAISGTIIHSYMENAKRGKTFEIDYSEAIKENLYEEVKERVEVLLPQAEAFHKDTLNKLFPIHMEYTVGIKDIIAGNIDLLCYNAYANEFQIWDYKNLKEFTTRNYYGKNCLNSFSRFQECSQVTYSIQLNMYKAILQRELGIPIGNCYLVHFNYANPDQGFRVYNCIDLQRECNFELDKLIEEETKNG